MNDPSNSATTIRAAGNKVQKYHIVAASATIWRQSARSHRVPETICFYLLAIQKPISDQNNLTLNSAEIFI